MNLEFFYIWHFWSLDSLPTPPARVSAQSKFLQFLPPLLSHHQLHSTNTSTNTTTNTIAPSPPKPSTPPLHQHLANQCLIETKELFLESCSTNFQLFPNFSTSFLGFFPPQFKLGVLLCLFWSGSYFAFREPKRAFIFDNHCTDWFDFFTFSICGL